MGEEEGGAGLPFTTPQLKQPQFSMCFGPHVFLPPRSC